jgi:hypothetical protein
VLLTFHWASTQNKGLRYHKPFIFLNKKWQHRRLSKICKTSKYTTICMDCHKPIDFISIFKQFNPNSQYQLLIQHKLPSRLNTLLSSHQSNLSITTLANTLKLTQSYHFLYFYFFPHLTNTTNMNQFIPHYNILNQFQYSLNII